MSAEKRRASNADPSKQLVKRPNLGGGGGGGGGDGVSKPGGGSSALIQSTQAPRTSGLQAPVMQLTGHADEVFCARFDPSGQLIASGSMDRTILLWRTYGGCENYGVLTGHRGAVLDLQWSRDADVLFSASTDMHLASWDLTTGQRIRRYVGHEEIVNALDVSRRGEEVLYSASDDGSLGVWDPRSKHAADVIQTDFPITAVAVAEAGHELYSGGIDNAVHVWDVRKKAVVYSLEGHQDTVTSLRVSPDGQSLLSFAMDATARTWDVRPFAPTERHIRTFDGAQMGMDKNLVHASWDPSSRRIATGSGDGTVVVWSTDNGKLLYKLPGHKGTVNAAEFSPADEPIILSASSDRTLLLGELK